jgi:small subunit ribosomal protein S20
VSAQVDGHSRNGFPWHPHASQSPDPGISLTDQSQKQQKDSFVANIKSQKKRILTNEKARQRNVAVKSELRTAIRAVDKAVTAGDQAAASSAVALASKKLDKAVSKGVIHKNQAANRKSGIAKRVNKISA